MALALSPSSIGGTLAELIAAGERIFSALKNVCVWNKTNGEIGTFFHSKHEIVFVFKFGTAPHEAGRARYRCLSRCHEPWRAGSRSLRRLRDDFHGG
jgi:hypothetical protein